MQTRLETIHTALVFEDSYQILIKYTMADAEVAEVVIRERGYGVDGKKEKCSTQVRGPQITTLCIFLLKSVGVCIIADALSKAFCT